MNQKFIFDEAGIKAFNIYVYGLGTVDFQNCLTRLQIGFDSWLDYYFEFNAEQLAYLEELPAAFKQQCQAMIHLALSQQIEIVLEKAEKPETTTKADRPGVGKMIGIDFGSTGSTANVPRISESSSDSATLTFQIWYQQE